MEKKRKPIWLKILLWIISSILSIVMLIGVACGFLYIKYEINVFEVNKQIAILNEEVDVNKIAPNAFTNEDMESAKLVTDASLEGLIKYSEQNGYEITFDGLENNLLGEIKFTDKQIGAIINEMIESQEKINVQLGSLINLKDYGFKVIQVDFSNISATTSDLNVVFKIDLDKLKEEKMNEFPYNWLRKGVPNSLYFSATVTITKGANAFEYTTTGKSLNINNLSSEETESLFKTINVLLKFGTTQEFSKVIGETFVNMLIGNENNSGFVYSLKDVGATDYSFETNNTNDYFVIEME